MGSCSSPSTIGSSDFKLTFIHQITMRLAILTSSSCPSNVFFWNSTKISSKKKKLCSYFLCYVFFQVMFSQNGANDSYSVDRTSEIRLSDFEPTYIRLITMKHAMRFLLVVLHRRFLEFSKNSPYPSWTGLNWFP